MEGTPGERFRSARLPPPVAPFFAPLFALVVAAPDDAFDGAFLRFLVGVEDVSFEGDFFLFGLLVVAVSFFAATADAAATVAAL